MPRPSRPGSSSSRPRSTNLGPKRGSTRPTRGTFLSKRPRNAISVVVTARVNAWLTTWTLHCSKRSLMRLLNTGHGVSRAIFSVSPCFTPDVLTLHDTSRAETAFITISSLQTGPNLMSMWTGSPDPKQWISCFGPGAPKPSSPPPRKPNLKNGASSGSALSPKSPRRRRT